MAFPGTTNAAGCGDGHSNTIVLPEGWHSMQDDDGVLHFFDLTGKQWQDDTTTAFDCQLARPDVDDLLNAGDRTIEHLDYGTNEQHESGVSPGKYQELMHSLLALYERALRQS